VTLPDRRPRSSRRRREQYRGWPIYQGDRKLREKRYPLFRVPIDAAAVNPTSTDDPGSGLPPREPVT
jgi:hypothetical protein